MCVYERLMGTRRHSEARSHCPPQSLAAQAKACRLLRAILNTAVDEDDLLSTNQCRIKAAGLEKTEERPS